MTTKITPDQAAHDALAHLIDVANGHHTRIADIMTDMTGESVTRQMVGRWLNPDAAKRQQPKLGTGLILCLVVDSLRPESERTFAATEVLEIVLTMNRRKPRERKPLDLK